MYDLETPALLLHLDIVERNVEQMAARARQLGVALRPHAKTLIPNHSCLTVAHFDEYHVVRGTGDGGQEVDRWKVERGR
jgi:D-serine deaminase-like pyridoxal phosphate-dependent protein